MNQTVPIKFAPIVVGTMRIGKGGHDLSDDQLERLIDQCIERGLSDFDHADIYGRYTVEDQFGRVVKKRPDLQRKLEITTKFGIKLISPNRPTHQIKSYDTSAAHIGFSVENSLKQLGIGQIKLLLIHRPDYLLQPDEVAKTIETLQQQGKIQYFGVSNFSTSQYELLNSFIPLATNQIAHSLLHLDALDDGTLDQCIRHGVQPMAWSPLGGGEVFGQSEDPRILRIQQKAQEISEHHGCTLDQVLLAWVAKHPSGIVPVVGSGRIDRIESARQAMEIKLSREQWYELLQASTGKAVA